MDLSSLKPKERFSRLVGRYLKYRPGYPPEIIIYLEENTNLNKNSIIADVGSGTGKLSELFLKHGCQVYGIEPNRKMRAAALRMLKRYKKYLSLEGCAESITLQNNSVDFITVGQAFHWFELKPTIKEFNRILKDNGYVVLIWNNRNSNSNDFMRGYEQLLREYGNDYNEIRGKQRDIRDMKKIFATDRVERFLFNNAQILNFKELKGRLESTSYCPLPGTEKYKKMVKKLSDLFKKYNKDNKVRIEYETEMFIIKKAKEEKSTVGVSEKSNHC
jgi:ubiquinone/menaquinone biosynthesis C-methylase UbiE